MPSSKTSFFWDDNISPVLNYAVLTVASRTADSMREGADRMLEYARANAPWNDRTGAARSGLDTYVEEFEDGIVSIELYHTVEYGVWLETIQDGALAIILPTLEALGPELLREAGAQVVRVQGGLL